MELNLKNIHSPCQNCYIHGHLYSPENDTCQGCEYNIAIQLVKVLLKFNEGCSVCKNGNRLGGGYWDCKIESNDDCVCNVAKDYVIDWQAAFKEYGFTFNN